jgi:hypothetical protein
MSTTDKPLAMRLAENLRGLQGRKSSKTACEAADELMRLAEVERELEAQRLYARALCKAIDAATDFAGTVAGGASWWDEVWAEHAAALDRARDRISLAQQGAEPPAAALAEVKRMKAQPAGEPVAPSQTTGMNIAQRILHVGGRNNAAGYVEFGSIQAIEALVRQVLRDAGAAPMPMPQSDGPPAAARVPLTMEQIEPAFAAKVGEWEDSSDRDGYDRALGWFARGARWATGQEGGVA